MKRWLRIMSLIMSVLLLSANMHAISARAANLDGANAAKIASAITSTAEQHARRQGKDYFKTLANGRIIYVKGFRVTNLNPPSHGQLLDSSATVTADSGLSWEIPVIWVDQNGNMLNIALDIDGVVACYPILAFYLPEGYAMAMGNNVTYDISMPDFVTDLMARSGVATLSNPASGVTYITPLLPGNNKVEANKTTQYYAYYNEVQEETESVPAQTEAKPYVPEEQRAGGSTGGGGGRKGKPNNYAKYKQEGTTEDLLIHCSDNAKNAFTEQQDDLAWFVSFVKNVIEPEATALLEKKFPAYKEAAKNNELGKNLGLYVYFEKADDASGGQNADETGDADEAGNSGTVAKVEWDYDDNGELTYRLCVDVSSFYELKTTDNKDGTQTTRYEFAEDEAYALLDNTIVHELMHVHMLDYTRTGMTGKQYDEKSKTYLNNEKVKYPEWFIEGMAMAVDSPYQYLNKPFKDCYGYSDGKYDKDSLINEYITSSAMKLGSAGTSNDDALKGVYASGYLANVYLAYLAANEYDKKDAIKEKNGKVISIDSKVILSGMNHILEKLHDGTPLDQIISEISPIDKENGKHFSGTEDFANKFIASNGEEGDGGASADFCAKLLNYFEQHSDEKASVNGSILLDFTNTQNYQLTTDLRKGKQTVYDIDDKTNEMVRSDVTNPDALKAGGTSETGIITDSSSDSSSNGASAETSTNPEEQQSSAKPALDKGSSLAENESENQDNASEGSTTERPADNSDKGDSSSGKGDKKPEDSSEGASHEKEDTASNEAEDSASESSSEDEELREEVELGEETGEDDASGKEDEETAEFPAEDDNSTEQNTENEQAKAPEPEAVPQPEAVPSQEAEPAPAPSEDYTPPSMIISEPEPEPAPSEPASQDNNQEVLDAVKPEPSNDDDSSSQENMGE